MFRGEHCTLQLLQEAASVFPIHKHRQHSFFFTLLETPKEGIFFECSQIPRTMFYDHFKNNSSPFLEYGWYTPFFCLCRSWHGLSSYQLSSKPYLPLRLKLSSRVSLRSLWTPAPTSVLRGLCFLCHLSLLFPFVHIPISPSRLQAPLRTEACPVPPLTVCRT